MVEGMVDGTLFRAYGEIHELPDRTNDGNDDAHENAAAGFVCLHHLIEPSLKTSPERRGFYFYIYVRNIFSGITIIGLHH